MLLNALLIRTKTKAILLPLVQNQFFYQVVNYLVVQVSEFFDVELLDTLVPVEHVTLVFFVADLAEDFHLWAFNFNMIIQLCPRQMLKIIDVADVAAEFWTVVLGVGLQLGKSLPNNLALPPCQIASVRKLTEIDAVAEDFVDFF